MHLLSFCKKHIWGYLDFNSVSVTLSDRDLLDGMLVHRRLPPQLLLVPIYTTGGRQKKVLLKDTGKQNVALWRFVPGTSGSEVRPLCHPALVRPIKFSTKKLHNFST
jgi:hypothetical protein